MYFYEVASQLYAPLLQADACLVLSPKSFKKYFILECKAFYIISNFLGVTR